VLGQEIWGVRVLDVEPVLATLADVFGHTFSSGGRHADEDANASALWTRWGEIKVFDRNDSTRPWAADLSDT
jgi:hypothetical protein